MVGHNVDLWEVLVFYGVSPLVRVLTYTCIMTVWLWPLTLMMAIERLLLTIYMPCDDRSTTSLNYDEFILYLGLVEAIIKESDRSSVFVICDWHAGINNNSVFGSEQSTFGTEHSYVLSDVDRLGCCSDSFTFLSEAHGTTPCIDHCVCTEQAHSSITEVSICYDMQSSYHFLIYICIDVNYVPRMYCAYIPPQSRLNWSKASADDRSIYRDTYAELLGTIELPQNAVCCSNTSCKDVSHIEGTNDLYCCIVNALHCTALNVIHVLSLPNGCVISRSVCVYVCVLLL